MPADWIRRTILIFTGATPLTFSLTHGDLVYRFFAGLIVSIALSMLFKEYQDRMSYSAPRRSRRPHKKTRQSPPVRQGPLFYQHWRRFVWWLCTPIIVALAPWPWGLILAVLAMGGFFLAVKGLIESAASAAQQESYQFYSHLMTSDNATLDRLEAALQCQATPHPVSDPEDAHRELGP